MFFYLSKIISFLFSPLVWIFICFVVAAFLKDVKRRKWLLILSVILFYLFSNSFLLREVDLLWEVPSAKLSDRKTYEAGIVLGGILNYDEENDRIQFQRSADRLFQAIELYKSGIIKKILFTGGSGSITLPNLKEGEFVKRYLIVIGIPENDIWIENESRNTHENAVDTKRLLEDKESTNEKFLLITSAYHMRRAMACFKKVKLNVTPYSVDNIAVKTGDLTLDTFLVPNVGALFWWDALIHEWIGMAIYKIQGYI